MLNIGLLFKPGLKETKQITDFLNQLQQENDVQFFILDDNKIFCPEEALCFFPAKSHPIDIILCFGGDGTMLRSVEYSLKNKAPVLGINYGKLGFLSECSFNDFKKSTLNLFQKKYKLESRMLIEIKVYRDNETIIKALALNDAVLYKGSSAKLVNLRLLSNNQYIYEMRSDGLVISTPTGSTAYSLSAGGAIISPNAKAIIATPLNPHILTIRPMVFSDNDKIEISLTSGGNVFLQIDGVNYCELRTNDKISVTRYHKSIDFIKLTKKSFYKILRHKLHMGRL